MLHANKLMDAERNESPSGSTSEPPSSDRHRQWRNHAGPVLDSAGEFDIVACTSCGFRHIVPIPCEEELQEVYAHEYYTVSKPLYLQQYAEDADWWELSYAERFDKFESSLPPTRRRILDVGSGPGLFLAHGQTRGWDVLGVEPSIAAAEHSRSLGVEVVTEFLTPETADALGSFDVVHASNVFEHLPDPALMLQTLRGLLSPQGIICVVVPNDYNPFQETLRGQQGYDPWWLAPPHHINYFDFDSLEQLLRRAEFEVVQRQTTFPMELFLLMGDNYVGDGELGRTCHAKRKRLETALAQGGLQDLKRTFYEGLAQQGVGREVVLYGRIP